MIKNKSNFLILIIICLISSFIFGCSESKTNIDTSESSYMLEIKSEGGYPLSNVGVYIYTDEEKNDLVWAKNTDKEGKISFNAEKRDNYVVFLENIPLGYKAEQNYQLTDENTEIILKTALIDIDDLYGVTFKLGDVFGDFSVTATSGKTYKISELLSEKKAVVLNFWFINCGPCRMEFPYLQEAYEQYNDDIEVLAINPLDGTDESIITYANNLSLTFPVAKGNEGFITSLNLSAYPTTVIIDRYGTVSMIHKGSITNTETFTKIFEYFVSDEYKQTTIRNISDIE